jgi:hypothetical protein
MRRALIIPLAFLALAPEASAAECAPPSRPGFVVAVCAGSAAVTGGERLRDARVIGDGSSAMVYVARLDLDGLLMEATLGPRGLPDGVPLSVGLHFEGAVLEREDGDDVVVARVRARRAFRSPETPLSEEAAIRVSDACFAFRRDVMPHQFSSSIVGQLRVFRRGRSRFARRLVGTDADGPFLEPIARSLRAGNRHLLSAERIFRRTRDLGRAMRPLRAYDRTFRREQRLLVRLKMGECA